MFPPESRVNAPLTARVAKGEWQSVRGNSLDHYRAFAQIVNDQNERHRERTTDEINTLDAKWRKETESKSKPLISATLSNPLSAYLTRLQAHSNGLFTEIFVMDDKGLNVGQSAISSDYWQGDEPKWQKTFGAGAGAIFVDEPEFNSDLKAWVVQVNLSVDDPQTRRAIGAATFEVNLSEMQRRR